MSLNAHRERAREKDSYTHVIMQLAIFVTVVVQVTSVYRKIKSYVINRY